MAELMTGEGAILLAGVLAVGLFAGFIGGLFGIGGGIVIVPALYAVFGILHVSPDAQIKVAVATSLATIIVTSSRSVMAHARRGAVEWPVLKAWWLWIAVGSVAGVAVAKAIPADLLTIVFALGAFAIAVRRILERDPKAGEPAQEERPIPTGPVRWLLAGGTGMASSVMGIGGGVIGVMILTGYGRPIHKAIATASGFGLLIAVPGAIGFMISGWGVDGLPPGSVGFVNLPAFAVIAAMTAMTAPLGARVAHALSRTLLSRVFAGYLALTAVLLLKDVLAG